MQNRTAYSGIAAFIARHFQEENQIYVQYVIASLNQITPTLTRISSLKKCAINLRRYLTNIKKYDTMKGETLTKAMMKGCEYMSIFKHAHKFEWVISPKLIGENVKQTAEYKCKCGKVQYRLKKIMFKNVLSVK